MYRYQCRRDLNFHSGLHGNYEIIIVTDGILTVTVNSEPIELKSGEGVFLPGYITHGFKTEKHSECHIFEYDTAFIGEKLSDSVNMFSVPKESFEFLAENGSSSSAFAEKSAVYYLFSCVRSPGTKIYNFAVEAVIQKALLFIAEHYAENITLSDTAEFCGVSYSYLSRIFKCSVGISFGECLNYTCVDRSINMLLYTSKSVTDIAMLCGFGTVRNFNRVFKSVIGSSPSEYRGTPG